MSVKLKVFLTVEIEKEDRTEDEDYIVKVCNEFRKKLRRKKISVQLKFTDLPRRFEREGFKKASDI